MKTKQKPGQKKKQEPRVRLLFLLFQRLDGGAARLMLLAAAARARLVAAWSFAGEIALQIVAVKLVAQLIAHFLHLLVGMGINLLIALAEEIRSGLSSFSVPFTISRAAAVA